jgi:hypothetical protein
MSGNTAATKSSILQNALTSKKHGADPLAILEINSPSSQPFALIQVVKVNRPKTTKSNNRVAVL